MPVGDNGRSRAVHRGWQRRCGVLSAVVPVVCATVLFSPVVSVSADPAAKSLTPAERNALARHFGFGPLEIFKLDQGISQLRTADVNGDGATDIVVANNRKSTIEVLLQRSAPPDEAETPKDVNDLVSHWRFERKKVSVTWEVACMKVADVTGDGKPDIVFFGDPEELVVFPGLGDGSFDDPVTRRVVDGLALPAGVEVADLNGDDRLDVVVLTEKDVLVLYQPEGGGLGKPLRFAHALENPLALKTVDINGDGRSDVVLLTDEEDYPLQIRLQNASGELGPVRRIKLPALSSGAFASCLARRQVDLFGVERVSGRMKRWSVDVGLEGMPDQDISVLYFPLPGEADADRLPFAIGDVNGDGRADIITADVEAAQLVSFIQQAERGIVRSHAFGGQVKMADLRCFDADGDGAAEVYVLSPEEERVARSVYRDHRLTYPKVLPTSGKPFALDVGRRRDGADPLLAYVAQNEDDEFELVIQSVNATATDDASVSRIELEDMDDPPSGVRWADVNGDGANDILVFPSYGSLAAVLQGADGSFAALTDNLSQAGLVKEARPHGFAFADTNGDGVREVLLAQKSFVRALHVNDEGAWEIIDQYNAPTSDAEIVGLCAMGDREKRPTLAMYDRRSREVHLYVPTDGGKYEQDRSVRVGAFDVKAMHAARVGGDGSPCIVLADARRFALIQPSKRGARAREKGVYESSIKDARLRGIAVGDLNGDGVSDVVVADTFDHFIEILTFGPDESLVRGNKFRVFAKKQYRQREKQQPEPRWVTVDDVTADGRDDLLLIAHDRILLYPGQ